MNGNELIQDVQFYDKYARWNDTLKRRETWEETVARVWEFFRTHTPLDTLSPETLTELRSGFLSKHALPAMRIIQMAGPALDRCHVGAYNCCYTPIENFKDIADALYILMQGTGVGFSVERKYTEKLPKIAPENHLMAFKFRIPDTTEGWADSVKYCLEYAAKGWRLDFDYRGIRPYGAKLTTKGGRASGPEPLKALHNFIIETCNRRRKAGFLRPIDVYDIVCMAGHIVEVGGVRRAALMCLCDLDDAEMRDAKQGDFWTTHIQRTRSNNSAVYTSLDVPVEFTSEFAALRANGTGERGIFNRAVANHGAGTRDVEYGTNPCGEIILRPRQFCNLSIAVARAGDSFEELRRKNKLAAIWGTLQATLTNFTYISPKYKENCEDERLLGVDINGQLDNEVFAGMFRGVSASRAVLGQLRNVAIGENKKLAEQFGINPARAVTTVKPSGNSSQFLDCSSGVHPRFAPFYIRRLRIAAGSPVARILEQHGVPGEGAIGEPTVKVFSFPVKSPEGSVTRHESSAVSQLQYWLKMRHYTQHNPSCTIYVKDNEWDTVEQIVKDNFGAINGLSFLPYDGGVYQQAPYEEITQEQYDALNKALPERIHWPKLLSEFENEDTTTSAREYACLSGHCEL
jgi:ribonucleoside-triphosphate reductase (thioredoxin)